MTEETPTWLETHVHLYGTKSLRCLTNKCMSWQQQYFSTSMPMKDAKHLDAMEEGKSLKYRGKVLHPTNIRSSAHGASDTHDRFYSIFYEIFYSIEDHSCSQEALCVLAGSHI